MRLSLIVPCFNEQDNIFPFARAVAEVFPDPSDYEIVFVNDGSKDGTLEIARSYATRFPGIVNVIDKENGHYGSCINA